MKTKSFVLLALVFFNTKSYCQFFDDVVKNAKTVLAAHVTLSSNNVLSKTNGSSSSAKSTIGYGFGVELIKPLGTKKRNWYINAMANFNTRGYQYVRANYIDFPITLNYTFKPRSMTWTGEQGYTWGIGMYAGYALWGKYLTNNNGWQKMKFGESASDNRSHIDYGFVLHAGVYIDEAFGLINIYMNFGLKNTIPKDRQTNANTFNHLNSLQVNWCVPIKGISKTTTKSKK